MNYSKISCKLKILNSAILQTDSNSLFTLCIYKTSNKGERFQRRQKTRECGVGVTCNTNKQNSQHRKTNYVTSQHAMPTLSQLLHTCMRVSKPKQKCTQKKKKYTNILFLCCTLKATSSYIQYIQRLIFFSEDTRRKTHRKSTENGVSIEGHLDYIHKVYLLFGRTVI